MKAFYVWAMLLIVAIAAFPGAVLAGDTVLTIGDLGMLGLAGITVGNGNPTLSDLAKRLDPDNSIATVIEVLNDTNEILDDMGWVEGNLPTGHKTTVRSGLPSVTWRLLNYGVQPSKSRTVPVTDTCGMLEAYAEVDKALADLNGNTAEFRMSEDVAFLEAMNQEMASTLFYGTDANPERFIGLSPRYDSYGSVDGDSSFNTIDGGGTDAVNTSIWMIVWGENTIHGIYPKGSQAGLSHRDLGEDTLDDGDGGKYQGYRTHWRYAVRICNIDTVKLLTFGSDSDTSANIIRLLIQAVNKIPNLGMGRGAIYVNRTVQTWLEIMAKEKANVQLSWQEFGEGKILTFRGIPIRRADALLETEAAVPSV
jgi:hypothetical protein